MESRDFPQPATMPVDRQHWARQINLCNFINSYYQYRDLQECENCRKILIIGPGQGLDPQILRWKGYEVITFDIDATFSPDRIGSVHNLQEFQDMEFDAVIASHVLEHLAVPLLDQSLREISRVGRYAIIYLPVAGRHMQLKFNLGFKGIEFSLIFDLFNIFHKPSGVEPCYCQRQHFWEVGMRGFRCKDIASRMRNFFEVLSIYRNNDWNSSMNFILKSKGTK